jgi:hypothetical protein
LQGAERTLLALVMRDQQRLCAEPALIHENHYEYVRAWTAKRALMELFPAVQFQHVR